MDRTLAFAKGWLQNRQITHKHDPVRLSPGDGLEAAIGSRGASTRPAEAEGFNDTHRLVE
jgi:hypothetical protein